MDAKKKVELLNNAMMLLCRVEIKGFEAKPAGEALEYVKGLYDAAKAELPEEKKEEENAKQINP